MNSTGLIISKGFHSFLVVIIVVCFISCNNSSVVEQKTDELIKLHADNKINNLEMLIQMGIMFNEKPENSKVKKEYLNRMVVSGYSSAVLHYYLLQPERIKTDEDQKIILYAIDKGMLYQLAEKFYPYFDDKNHQLLEKYKDFNTTLNKLNDDIATEYRSDLLAERGAFFRAVEQDIPANWDLKISSQNDPCNSQVVFQNILSLFAQEKTSSIITLLNQCNEELNDNNAGNWKDTFKEVAESVEDIKESEMNEQERLFQLARIYSGNGFAEVGLKKSGELIRRFPENADYLAIHAFGYYQMKDKKNALKYITEAETITGTRSRLREMIEQMDVN